MDYITSQTPDKGVQIGPEPPISNDSIALTPDKGVQIGKELPIINASIALTPDKGVQIGPEPPTSNDSIAMVPDKGVQVGPELPISNDSIAMASDTTPGFAGNLIEAGIVLNGTKSAVYKSAAYPANADGKQRPGAVVEYSSEFSVGEGFSVGGTKSELPEGYLRAEFLESTGTQGILLPLDALAGKAVKMESEVMYTGRPAANQAHLEGAGFGSTGVRVGLYGGANHASFYMQAGSAANLDAGQVSGGEPFRVYIASYTPNLERRLVFQKEVKDANASSTLNLSLGCALFAVRQYYGNKALYSFNKQRKKYFIFSVEGQIKYNLRPGLDAQGVPSMYDIVSKQPFYNSGTGAFIAGFTIQQARKLGAHLPEGGGALTISLPTGYEQDAAVANALEIARLKGWTLTIQTYTPETNTEGASTFALKRIWVRKTQDDNGAYIDTNGSRWQVDWCVDMITPDGSTPDAYGYEMFRNIEAATEYWGLTSWVDPEQEEEFLQEL